MKTMNKVFLLISLMLLSGCFWNVEPDEPVQVSYTPVEKPALIVPEVDEIRGREVDWILVTEENVEEVFERLDASGRSVVLFALSDSGYESLSLNLQDIMTLIQQQQAVISSYERYYEESQEEIDSANEENRNRIQDINERLQSNDDD